MFQLTSYVNMYVFALLGAFVFLGGWEWPFGTRHRLGATSSC